MFRKLILAVAVAAFVTPIAFADDEKKSDNKKSPARARAGKPDKSKVFEMMDADSDRKISKDEFATGLEKIIEKLKENAGDRAGKGGALEKFGEKIAQKTFEKMDTDQDGSISKEEFEKSNFDLSNLKELRAKIGIDKDK
jgi:hypothetical protein